MRMLLRFYFSKNKITRVMPEALMMRIFHIPNVVSKGGEWMPKALS